MRTKLRELSDYPRLTDHPVMEIPLNQLKGRRFILDSHPRFTGANIECDVLWFIGFSGLNTIVSQNQNASYESATVRIGYDNLLGHAKKICNDLGYRTRPGFVEAYYEDQYKTVIENYLQESEEWEEAA